MAKGDYKKKVTDEMYFPAFEKLTGKKLTHKKKSDLRSMTFNQLETVGRLIASAANQDWDLWYE